MSASNVQLDDMLKAPEAALWLKLSQRELIQKSKGNKPVIPAFWLNTRVVRFNPRIIIAKLADDAGVSADVIAAAMNVTLR